MSFLINPYIHGGIKSAGLAVPFTTPLSTGTLDITTENLNGKVPIAVMFFGGMMTATEGSMNNWNYCNGASDGVNQWCVSSAALNDSNRLSQSGVGFHTISSCLTHYDHTETLKYSAAIDSFIPNGVRLNFTAVDVSARQCIAVLFYSEEGQAAAGAVIGVVASPGVDEVLGFEPDVILTASRMRGASVYDVVEGPSLAFTNQINRFNSGFAVNGSDQFVSSVIGAISSGAGAQNHTGYLSNFAAWAFTSNTSIGATSAVRFNEDGFSVYRASGSSDVSTAAHFYLALKIPELIFTAEPTTIPTATGLLETDPSIEPTFMMLIANRATAFNTLATHANQFNWAYLSLDDETPFGCSIGVSHWGNANGHNRSGFSDNRIYGIIGGTDSSPQPNPEYVGSLSSFGPTSAVIDYTNGAAGVYVAAALFAGDNPDIDTSFNAFSKNQTWPVSSTGIIEYRDTNMSRQKPKAMLNFNARLATADRVAKADFHMCFGITDGVSQSINSIISVNGSTSSAGAFYNGNNDNIAAGAYASVIVAEGMQFDSWIKDGVRMNIYDAAPSTFIMGSTFLSGDNLEVKAGTFIPATGAGTDVDVGFEPDAVILFSIGAPFDFGASTQSRISIGFVAWDDVGAKTELYAGTSEDTGFTRLYRSALNNDAAAVEINSVSDAINYKVNLTRTGTGFTAISDVSAGTDGISYLALKIDGGGARAGTWALPTGTGAASKTGVGIAPKCVFLAGTERTATGIGSGTLLAFGVLTENGVTSIAGSRTSDGAASGGAAPTAERTVLAEAGLYGVFPDSTVDYDMTLTSLDADGWTMNVVDAPAGAYLWNYLALG